MTNNEFIGLFTLVAFLIWVFVMSFRKIPGDKTQRFYNETKFKDDTYLESERPSVDKK